MHACIMVKIVRERIKIAKRKLIIFISITIASVGVFVLALQYTINQFAQSNFPHYLSLIYSDTSLLSIYWKDLTYSFVESVPLVSITLLLLATFALLAVFHQTLQNVAAEKMLQKNLAIV